MGKNKRIKWCLLVMENLRSTYLGESLLSVSPLPLMFEIVSIILSSFYFYQSINRLVMIQEAHILILSFLFRIGALVIRGNLTAVTATSDAIAPLYISGVQTSAGLNLSSTADAFIEQVSVYIFKILREWENSSKRFEHRVR